MANFLRRNVRDREIWKIKSEKQELSKISVFIYLKIEKRETKHCNRW